MGQSLLSILKIKSFLLTLWLCSHHPEVRLEGREPLPDHAMESTLLSRSGGEKGLRGSGAGTLVFPLEGTRRVGELLGSHEGAAAAAAAAAKSFQSCPTLCDPIDGSPPGSPNTGTLQARTLEWVAISFSNA